MKPLLFRWSKDSCVMTPVGRRNSQAAFVQFIDGCSYLLEPSYPRSKASHDHFFAFMHHVWDNMPEVVDKWWPNIEVFRKWSLIQCDWYRISTYTAESDGEAERHILWLNKEHKYTQNSRDGMVVITRIAESMSFHDMSEKEFRETKEKVFALWFAMTGIDPEKLANEAVVA